MDLIPEVADGEQLRRPGRIVLAVIIGPGDPHVRFNPDEGTKRRAEPEYPMILKCESREGGTK